MKNQEFRFEINSQLTIEEFNQVLAKMTEAAHALVECAMHNKIPANSPDCANLFQAAGSLNAAFYFNTQIKNGVDPRQASQPVIRVN